MKKILLNKLKSIDPIVFNFKENILNFFSIAIGFIAIAIFSFQFIFEDHIIYGSGVSVQHFPIVVSFQQNLLSFIYPFFDFKFGIGFDSLADSQQSLLHPVKIALAFLLKDAYQIDTYFLVFHLFFLNVSGAFFISRLLLREENKIGLKKSAWLLSSSIGISLAIYTNLIHIYYIPALAYGLLLGAFLIDAQKNPKSKNLIGIAFSTTLMLLCGNFTLQWIILGWLFTYSIIYAYKNKKPLSFYLPILFSFILGCLFALPQILPTFDLMLVTSRASTGGGSRFAMSSGPFQFFSYIAPGAVFFVYEHAPHVFGFMTGNNVVEGAHYVGVITLAAFLSAWRQKLSNVQIAIFTITLIFILLRSLGVFSPINIILNNLPIFGQFRGSVRYLFAVDISICLLASIYFYSYFDKSNFKRFINLLIMLWASITILCILVGTTDFFLRWNLLPTMGLFEIIYILIPLLILLISRLALSADFLGRTSIVLFLSCLILLDLLGHAYGAPTHWQAPHASQLREMTVGIDQLCNSKKTNHVVLLKPDNWSNSWFRFDLPIFPHRKIDHHLYPTDETRPGIEPNGYNCSVTHTLKSSTLTPNPTVSLDEWFHTLNLNDRLSLIQFLEYDQAIIFDSKKASALLLKDRSLEINIEGPKQTSIKSIQALANFINMQPPQKQSIFNSLTLPMYKYLQLHGLENYLPTTARVPKLVPGVGYVIAMQAPWSYILIGSKGQLLPAHTKGSFAVFSDNHKEIKVIFIPTAFILGICISIFSIIIGSIALFFWSRRKISKVSEVKNSRTIYIESTYELLVQNLKKIGSNKIIFRSLIFSIFGFATAFISIAIAMSRFQNALHMFVLLSFVPLFYLIVFRITEDKFLSRGISLLVFISYSFGIVMLFYLYRF